MPNNDYNRLKTCKGTNNREQNKTTCCFFCQDAANDANNSRPLPRIAYPKKWVADTSRVGHPEKAMRKNNIVLLLGEYLLVEVVHERLLIVVTDGQ